jgi:3-phosphoglycerate kinase
MHDNIKANDFTRKPELRNSFLSKINFGGEPIEFPYNSEGEIFDVSKIIASLEEGDVVIPENLRIQSQEDFQGVISDVVAEEVGTDMPQAEQQADTIIGAE